MWYQRPHIWPSKLFALRDWWLRKSMLVGMNVSCFVMIQTKNDGVVIRGGMELPGRWHGILLELPRGDEKRRQLQNMHNYLIGTRKHTRLIIIYSIHLMLFRGVPLISSMHFLWAKEYSLCNYMDGMDPFSHMSNSHSVWLVLLSIYNLPSYWCNKIKYMMMWVLIPVLH